jgi:drug/metabolite transporter (DMT)-like permease
MSSAAPTAARSQRLRSDGLLLLTAVVWGSGFIAGRVGALHLDPWIYNGLRFLVGSLVLLPLVARRLGGLSRLELWGGIAAGALLMVSSNLQQVGLALTTAGQAGFITGLYVVLVPLFGALIWRRWPPWSVWLAAGLATVGLFPLSGVGRLRLTAGDAWELAGAVGWALHILLIGALARKVDVLRLTVVQNVASGVLGLAVGFAVSPQPFVGWHSAWWTILYNGVLSVGVGFTLQAVGQRHAPATDCAVILSLEAVFAAFFGWLILSEALAWPQIVGCGLMLAGMLLAQIRRRTRASTSGILPA